MNKAYIMLIVLVCATPAFGNPINTGNSNKTFSDKDEARGNGNKTLGNSDEIQGNQDRTPGHKN